jgi:hypothetical protein
MTKVQFTKYIRSFVTSNNDNNLIIIQLNSYLFMWKLNNPKTNYKVSTRNGKKQNTSQGNLYHLNNNKKIIQFNSYLFMCKSNSTKTNYEVGTSKEKETKHTWIKYRNKDIYIIWIIIIIPLTQSYHWEAWKTKYIHLQQIRIVIWILE